MAGSMLSIGECMVELMQAEGGMLRKGYAGDTFNTAYYARLFAPAGWTVEYLTAVGTDVVSDELLSFIDSTGVGTAHIARIEGRMPGLYMIHLKDGERSFSYWRSTSAAKLLADDPERLRAAIEKVDVVFFSGITLAILAPDAVENIAGGTAAGKGERHARRLRSEYPPSPLGRRGSDAGDARSRRALSNDGVAEL